MPGHRNAWNAPKEAAWVCSCKITAIDSKVAVYVLHYAQACRDTPYFLTVITVPYRNTPYNTVQV